MNSNYIILFIDDDEDDMMLFTRAVKNISYTRPVTCIFIDNCADALQKMQQGFRPDIIFLDLNMPVIHGFEFLKKIRESDAFSNIPVVIFSTSGYSTDVEKARQLGAAGYLKKPSDFDTLDYKISNFIKHVSASNEDYMIDL